MALSHRLIISLAVSFLLSFFDWGNKALFPFKIFTTWLHECWHALIALILGATDIRIELNPDASGLTHYKIQDGKLKRACIACAGYLGASFSGCLILFLKVATEKHIEHWNIQAMITILCILITLSLIFWIRNLFGFLSTLILGIALGSLIYFPVLTPYSQPIILFLAIQTALNSLFDIRILFELKSSKGHMSDAHTLQKLFYLPHWVWAIAWLSISLMMMYFTLHLI